MDKKEKVSCECAKCTGVEDLRASPIELSMGMLRSTPGLLLALQLRSVLCVIKACDKKVDEIFTGGHTYMSGDQLFRDFSAVRVVAGHIAKSIGEQFHDDVKLGLWEADLYKAVFNMETFVKHEAGTLTWQMAPYVPKNAYHPESRFFESYKK